MKTFKLKSGLKFSLDATVSKSRLMFLGLAATIALYASPVAAQVSFLSAPNYPAGEALLSVKAGDLDGDGDLDLAATSRDDYDAGPGNVFVFKNKGDGTFAAAQEVTTGTGPVSLTVGDLDGDGDLDLATANSSGIYNLSAITSVLTNNGDGTFAAVQTFALGESPDSINAADLDRDGDLDLAATGAKGVLVLKSTTPTLQLSTSASRTNPVPLAAQTVSGNIYVFASGQDADFLRVNFYLDDPDKSGAPIRLERAAPFDFAGGTNMNPTVTQAMPFDTSTLTNGTHTITATFALSNGKFRTVTSSFTVSN